jgi:hypothetical protein
MAIEYNVITPADAAAAAAPPAGGGAPPVGGAPPAATTPDDAFDKLFKYIPSVTVGTYLAIQGVVSQVTDVTARKWVLLLSCVVLLFGTYVFLKQRNVKRGVQLFTSIGAFVVWVFALGGPFQLFWSGWEQWMGSIALFLGAFLVAAWNPPPLPAD